MGFFDKVKKAFKGAAEEGKKQAGAAGDFTLEVGEKAGELTAESMTAAADAARDGADTAADKAGETLTPKSAPRRL